MDPEKIMQAIAVIKQAIMELENSIRGAAAPGAGAGPGPGAARPPMPPRGASVPPGGPGGAPAGIRGRLGV